jgi:hypothetical protein
MKPLKRLNWLGYLVAAGVFIGRLSIEVVGAKGVGKSGLSILVWFKSVLNRVIGCRRKVREPRSIGLDLGAHTLRRALRSVPRLGWRQLYLPEDTESSLDHTDGCIHILIKVAPKLELSIQQLSEGVEMLSVHETDEAARSKDIPLISSSQMPRSREGRIAFMRYVWVPPSRDAELQRMREAYERALPLIIRWVEENVSGDQRQLWLKRVEDFHLVRGRVAEVCFEVHAYQPALMAVLLAIETSKLKNGPKKFPPEAAEAWLRRAEELITLEPLKVRLENLKTVQASLVQERLSKELK